MSAAAAPPPVQAADDQQQQVVSEGGDGDNLAAAQNPQLNRQPSQLESFFAVTKSLIIRALVIYFITSFFRRPQPTATNAPLDPNDPNGIKSTIASRASPAFNFFDNGTVFDLHAYLSEDFERVPFDDPRSLAWFQEGLIYGDWTSGPNGDGTYERLLKFRPSAQLQRNGSLYLHVYVTRFGQSPDPRAGPLYAGKELGYMRRQLNKFKRIRYARTHNLLTGESSLTPEEQRKADLQIQEIVSHWHPNMTINLVTDQTQWVPGAVPPPLDEFVHFHPSGQTYYPIVFGNDFWNMGRDYRPLNETVEELELRLTYQPLSMFKWQLYAAQQMRNKWSAGIWGEALAGAAQAAGGGDEEASDEDQDSLKETLLETNAYLLAVTVVISILHSVFELLAFKNDIQFWNNRKSLEGLSVRSVFFSVFQSLIVLLYVLDNETNMMIKLSCFVGLGIEVWKIQKVVDFRLVGWRLTFEDKGSYAESPTKEYDGLAFRYLSWICFPLLLCFGVYSVYYNEHKGWYSFVLNMLYGYLLTFGFIMMTPQLFINYKLKSVAHLPWRMMTYKFLNTFIDDIFAFVIKMPTLYRLGCFRDDIVFFIFLYQKWVYKVDHTRVNEFGFSGEMEDEAKRQLLPAGDGATDATKTQAIEAAPAATKAKSPARKKKD